MTYCYMMSGDTMAVICRVDADGLLFAEAHIDGGNLTQPGDIKAIAKATVAALNGEASASALCDAASELGKKVNVRLNAEAVRNLASGGQLRVNEGVTISGASDIANAWHPKAVEALRRLDNLWTSDFAQGPDEAPMLTDETRGIWRAIREAIALVDQAPPAEKVVGWGILWADRKSLFQAIWDDPDEARKAWAGNGIVRLVEEPSK